MARGAGRLELVVGVAGDAALGAGEEGVGGTEYAEIVGGRRRLVEAIKWFATPRTTLAPHLAGPFVDYACTNTYALTLSTPLLRDGMCLGVAAADVLVSSLERQIVPRLADLGHPAALITAAGRVIAPNAPEPIAGQRLQMERRRPRSPPIRSRRCARACSSFRPAEPSDQPIVFVFGAPTPLGAPLAMLSPGNELVRAPAIRLKRVELDPEGTAGHHLGAGGDGFRLQVAVGGDDHHLVFRQPAGEPSEDLAVGGIRAAAARPGDLDPAGAEAPARLVLEHHRHPLLAALGPPLDPPDEALDRPLAVAPPPVGPGSDHVHRIDDSVHRDIIPRGPTRAAGSTA